MQSVCTLIYFSVLIAVGALLGTAKMRYVVNLCENSECC